MLRKPVGFRISLSILLIGLICGCAGKILKFERSEDLKKIKEFEQTVKIEIPEESKPTETVGTDPTNVTSGQDQKTPTPSPAPEPSKNKNEKKSAKKKDKKNIPPTLSPVQVIKKMPELESDVGFVGRRPIVDPFKIGEKVVHSVNYFKMRAGFLTMETKPFATVNGKKSYNFEMSIRTSDFFSSFYSVDDRVTTLVDYETFIPSVFQLHVQETAQLREARAFFDEEKKIAKFWEKKVSKKSGEEERKLEWEILEYSQNVYSAVYYLRAFTWEVGKENAFRVAHDNDNLIFRAKAIRKEKIETEAGNFETIVIKPEIELKGQFRPVGDIFIWLSDDPRKFLLKIESKIKIGTLVSEVVEIVPGRD